MSGQFRLRMPLSPVALNLAPTLIRRHSLSKTGVFDAPMAPPSPARGEGEGGALI
jgi:hypothetical protein